MVVMLEEGYITLRGEIILSSDEARRVAQNMLVAADEAEDHDGFAFAVMFMSSQDCLKFHLKGKRNEAQTACAVQG